MNARQARNELILVLNESDEVRSAHADEESDGTPAVVVQFMSGEIVSLAVTLR